MTTTVSADNTVKIPDALARLLDLKPGTALDWQDRHPDTAAEYEALFDVAIPVDNVVARAAFQLKRDTPKRLPTLMP